MLDISQMILRLLIAIALGGLMGLERNLAGKEAGVRTSLLVASGATIFSMLALELPYIVAPTQESLQGILANSTYMNIIGNIVVGIGFLGAGIIIKTQEHVHGLTTAAAIWTTAAIGVLVGIGLATFAAVATIILVGLLFILRKMDIAEKLSRESS